MPPWSVDNSIIATGLANPNNSRPNHGNLGAAFQSFLRPQGTPGPLPSFSAPPIPVAQPPPAAVRNRAGLTHTLSKWMVRFSGNTSDLPIDEFFFRIKNLAAEENIHSAKLLLGLHCLLAENASNFYWVQRRKYPDHTWGMLKRSMMAHLAKQETDIEIRKLTMGRFQGANEGFGDFSLAVECLARLSRPMADVELVDILRQNMSPRLQTCLLMFDIISI